jgi:hypothetical protein
VASAVEQYVPQNIFNVDKNARFHWQLKRKHHMEDEYEDRITQRGVKSYGHLSWAGLVKKHYMKI